MHRLTSVATRNRSTLAEKLRSATGGSDYKKSKQMFSGSVAVKNEKGEEFRELYVMPKRKLCGQTQLEHATGRTVYITRSRTDIMDRSAERPPRSEEMDPESQEWKDVWPAARTSAASVVLLPVWMGSRPNFEKRAPFKKEGNLELVKIPNFLHLTPAAIKQHCEAIKCECSSKTLRNQATNTNSKCFSSAPNFHWSSSRIHLSSHRMLQSLCSTTPTSGSKLKDGKMIVITDRNHTRAQNIEYAHYLLTVLFHEAQKTEKWDDLTVMSNMSKLVESIGKSTNEGSDKPKTIRI